MVVGWVPAPHFLLLFTAFGDIEALGLETQHRNSPLPLYLQYIIDLLRPGRLRSEGPQLGELWEPQETPRRPSGTFQMTPGTSQETTQETFQESTQETSQESTQQTS